MKTRIVPAATPQEIASAVPIAVDYLRRGEAIALPTETVYGLAADALEIEATLKIFEAKERPRFDPLIVHLPQRDWLERIAVIPAGDEELVRELFDRFWPGPLTLVLPRQKIVPDVVTAGLQTVAVRMSAHPVFTQIIDVFGKPIAAPSANRFGRISATTASHVLAELEGRIPLIVDGGSTTHGLESTIIAVRSGKIEILRRGPITAEQLGEIGDVRIARLPEQPKAPGQLRSHYAPRTPLRLTASLATFDSPGGKVGALSFGPSEMRGFADIRTLSASRDLREAAANLFLCLRELDDARFDLIVAEEIPELGLGAAIMDRLRRAAAR